MSWAIKTSVLLFFQDKFDDCKKHLEMAKKVLTVTHGGKHRVVTETLESLIQQYKEFSKMFANGSGPIHKILS